jgi:hypothetical protein
MKPLLLLGCTLLAGTALHAQFRLLPHAGFEQARTTVTTDRGSSLQDINGFLKAGLRAGYELKGGHSPFINLTTNPAPVSFAFDNAGTLLNRSRSGNLQFRLEAGYLFNSKPIQLGKRSTPTSTITALSEQTATQKSRCGSSAYRSSCGSKKTALTQAAGRVLNMRLQPSLALAYVPSSIQSIEQKAGGFNYTPSWKTAIVPALGFEFANGNQRLFTLGVFYTRPLGQKDEVANTYLESKSITTQLQPQMATWGLTLGLPFSLAKNKTSANKTQSPKKGCTRTYYRRCTRLS